MSYSKDQIKKITLSIVTINLIILLVSCGNTSDEIMNLECRYDNKYTAVNIFSFNKKEGQLAERIQESKGETEAWTNIPVTWSPSSITIKINGDAGGASFDSAYIISRESMRMVKQTTFYVGGSKIAEEEVTGSCKEVSIDRAKNRF